MGLYYLVCKFVIDLYILFCILSSIPLVGEERTRCKYWLMYMYIQYLFSKMITNECTKVHNPRVPPRLRIFMALTIRPNAHAHYGRPNLWLSMEGVLDLRNGAVSEKNPQIFDLCYRWVCDSIFRTNGCSRGKMWLNRHTPETKYHNPRCTCVPRVTCAARVNYMYMYLISSRVYHIQTISVIIILNICTTKL